MQGRRLIPAGSGLPDDVWRGRHRWIVGLAFAHAVGVVIYAVRQGRTPEHGVLEGAPIAALATVAALPYVSRQIRTIAASAALLTSSAVLVHLSGGLIEMHFHFFVMVPVVALYQAWPPFLLSIGYVLVHHGLMGQLAPESVFNHRWGQADPWAWAGVHALFIAATSAVCLATWRLHEAMAAKQRTTGDALLEEKQVVETLHSVGSGIVAELNIDRVSELVTDAGVAATGAAFGAFFYNVYDSAGERYMLYTLSGAPRSAFEKFPMPRNTKIFEPTFGGTGVVRLDDVLEDERYGQNSPYFGMPPGHLPVRSYLAVPVRSRGSSEVLGGLFFGHPEVGKFTESHERIVVGLATQAAIAFDNARLYEAERVAREASESARARLTMLADVGRLLVASLDPDTTLGNLARITVPTLADICIIDMLDAVGQIRRVAVFAAPGLEEVEESLRLCPPSRENTEHPVARVLGSGNSEQLDAVADDVFIDAAPGPEHAAVVRRLRGRGSIIVPLVGRDEVIGAVSFLLTDAAERSFEPDDLPLAEILGRRAGMAVENARLYQAELEARTAADRATRRLLFLAEIGRNVTSTLEEDVALDRLAKLTVPMLADACLIDIINDDGKISRIASGGPGLEAFAQGLVPFPPGFNDHAHPLVKVMRTGEPLLVERVTPAFLDSITRHPQHREIADELHPRSTMIVPLRGRDRIYGSLAFINVEMSGRLFDQDDFALAEEVGRRAGLAMDNARLHSEQRGVAESLQHALLPEQLPSLPGFEAAARYMPGSPGEKVGGDWYDLFQIPTGEIAIVMGDVVGHGIAAASLMAQLRNALRAYVWDGLEPKKVLSRLNHLVYGLEKEGMATVIVGLLDPVTNTLRLSNAGHPPILLMRDKQTWFAGEGLGPPIGAIPFVSYAEIAVDLRPNDTAVFYTDGLVEERTASLDAGLALMRDTLTNTEGTPDELCDAIVTTCLEGRLVEDDVAVLVLKSLPLGDRLRLRLPAEPRVLASLRQTIKRWLHEHSVREDLVQDVLVAIGEACNNAIEHGSASLRGFFDLEAWIDDDLHVVIRNDGSWRGARETGGGRGLPLMEALMDDVEIDRSPLTTEVRMRRSLVAAEPVRT
jgi:GAF domain-containing protein/anti-sigma regulatory factor (Ser/Thr protein kinase)